MDSTVVVGISDMRVTARPGVLVTYALGSCVGVCLYDGVSGVCGLSHILLPDSRLCPGDRNPNKFADTAVRALVARMVKEGAALARITAKIIGGARFFGEGGMDIGRRNVAAVKEQLERLHIPLVGEDTGRNYGRTVEFSAGDGRVVVRTALKGMKII
jgi:chemotaxis protein CheD